MTGEFSLRAIAFPSKTVLIQYTLENKDEFCELPIIPLKVIML